MFQHFRLFRWLWLMVVAGVVSGCCGRRPTAGPIHYPTLESTPVLKPGETNIGSDFSGVDQLDNEATFSADQFLSGDSFQLQLEECCCLAGNQSKIANAIDLERLAVAQSESNREFLDQFLGGQALQQRNVAASAAGELFLKLVELNLQADLINQSQEKLDEFQQASYVAANAGLATSEADIELSAKRTDLNQKLLEIEKSKVSVIIQLAALIGLDDSKDDSKSLNIAPDFQLAPVYEPVDLASEIQRALQERPDLQFASGDYMKHDVEANSILSQLDSRLGIASIGPLKKLAVRRQLELHSARLLPIRQLQLESLKSAQQDLIEIAVTDAVAEIESNYQTLQLRNERVRHLEKRAKAIEAASELNAQKSFLDSIENWAQQQTARSERISAAIAFEAAKIQLLGATGRWVEICGFQSSSYQPVSDCKRCSR